MDSVLITGVSTGIGLETAKYLKALGYHIFGFGSQVKQAAALEQEMGQGLQH
ncbi:MAG: SDR family NAD(P)-dependent oxidoreductase [Saprospiraceae bacterium]|nr:SDR family NAD(P)-dependent oxidoreductase [Saprospiraceae bacterium]